MRTVLCALVVGLLFAPGAPGEEPPDRTEKKVDLADTVWILSLDRDGERIIAVTRGRQDDGSPGPVGRTYAIDEHTVVRSGEETIPASQLRIGDRVVVEASLEPDTADEADDRVRVAREIVLVVDRPGPGATPPE